MTFLSDFLGNHSRSARVGLVVGAVLILSGAIASLWWLATPKFQLLFGNLVETDAAEISKSLTEWKIPFEFSDEGRAIVVPAEQVYSTRMKLVSAGVPSRGHVGFELFDDSDFGVTEFAQRVNYQRAIQGELERSIAALPGVDNVRVHLTIRRPGLFVGDDDSSKASVAVGMRSGQSLNPPQVAGIRNLVASAVEGLSPGAVIVLGPAGILKGGAGGDEDHQPIERGEVQGDYENKLRERINGLLNEIFPGHNFQVSVDARLNFDQVRKVSERLIAQGRDGNGLVVRKHISRTSAAAKDGAETSMPQSQEEFDYAHGTEREEIARAPGTLERLSIAVLVPPALTNGEMDRLRKLVTAASGLDSARGDRLEVAAFDAVPDGHDATGDDAMHMSKVAPQPADEATRDMTHAPSTQWVWFTSAILGGILFGWMSAVLLRPRSPKLRTEERDAVLAKVRSWLVDKGEDA